MNEKKVLVKYSIIIVLLGSAFVYGLIALRNREKLLEEGGKKLKTVVIRHDFFSSAKYVACNFSVGGKEYEVRTKAKYFERDYKVNFEIGDSVVVSYLPDDPDNAEVDFSASVKAFGKDYYR